MASSPNCWWIGKPPFWPMPLKSSRAIIPKNALDTNPIIRVIIGGTLLMDRISPNLCFKAISTMALTDDQQTAINQVMSQSVNTTVFHSTEWNALLQETFVVESITLLAFKEDCLQGVYTFFITSDLKLLSPPEQFESIYGGPIAINDDRGVICALLQFSRNLRRCSLYRISVPPEMDLSPFTDRGYSIRKLFYTSLIDLRKSNEDLWGSFDGKRARTPIRKAEKNGVEVIDGDISNLPSYYLILKDVLSRANVHLLPQYYYAKILSSLRRQVRTKFLIAKCRGELVGGAIFLCFGKVACYWSGATTEAGRDLYASDLIQWEFIKWAKLAGYETYDLLRFHPELLPGITQFKRKFGGKEIPLYVAERASLGNQLKRAAHALTDPASIPSKIRSRLRML